MIPILVCVAIAFIAIYLYFKFFKLFKIKSICFIDGSLGTGKSFYSVYLAIRIYKRELRRWKVLTFVGRCFKPFSRFAWCANIAQLADAEKPLLYSNMLLRNVEFVKVTRDILFRQNFRMAYKSVLLLDEFSLMADQYLYRDREMSERLSEFFKLFRHATKGGHCIINSQSTSDMPTALKYVLSDYLYIHHRVNAPFFSALKVQEMIYSADREGSNVVNANGGDIEDTLKLILVPNKYKKYYDHVCYSIFTDCLPVYSHVLVKGKDDSLKDENLVSFKTYTFLMENLEKERKKNKEKPVVKEGDAK